MKRFTVSILCASVFFVGLGSLADSVAARFSSDDKAMEIVRRSRLAIGGEQALNEVRGLIITGQATRSVKFDGVERMESGETQIALEFPNRFMKMVKLGDGNALAEGQPGAVKRSEVMVFRRGEGGELNVEGKDGIVVTGEGREFLLKRSEDGAGEFTTEDGRRIVVRKTDGTENILGGEQREIEIEGGKMVVRRSGEGTAEFTARRAEGASTDGKNVVIQRSGVPAAHSMSRDNEMLRTALALLLKAPEGIDVTYGFAGEGSVDGTAVNIITATSGRTLLRLHIDKFTYMPVAVSFTGSSMPQLVRFSRSGDEGGKENFVIGHKGDDQPASVETMVKFSDFRSANGVLLPHRWTTTVGGRINETFDITSYEINPANLAERFSNEKMRIKMTRPSEN